MSEGYENNPNYLLNTADRAIIHLYTQSGWTIGNSVVFRNNKPTVASGSIIGDRALTTDEVNAFNSILGWNSASHMITIYTTNSYIANLSGKELMLVF